VKPNINLVEVQPQVSSKGHPVDGALVGADSLWPLQCTFQHFQRDVQANLPRLHTIWSLFLPRSIVFFFAMSHFDESIRRRRKKKNSETLEAP
jgi:hypothetical protein